MEGRYALRKTGPRRTRCWGRLSAGDFRLAAKAVGRPQTAPGGLLPGLLDTAPMVGDARFSFRVVPSGIPLKNQPPEPFGVRRIFAAGRFFVAFGGAFRAVGHSIESSGEYPKFSRPPMSRRAAARRDILAC